MDGYLLTKQEILELRAAVRAAEARADAGPWQWATCINGPLAGTRTKVSIAIHNAPEASFGWCKLTYWGAVVANYRQTGVPGQWRFSGYMCPGEPWRGTFCLLARSAD
jgi:hypothetical protein